MKQQQGEARLHQEHVVIFGFLGATQYGLNETWNGNADVLGLRVKLRAISGGISDVSNIDPVDYTFGLLVFKPGEASDYSGSQKQL